ncbi:MAG: ATP synthase F1 subunit epsilon [Rhodospirillaceae bacterium]|nr:ATP synthase F1 subunit epsilon [Rhodospirillaceae bacterium]
MAATTRFELVSPERLFFSQPAEMVVVPGAEGDFGAQPGHMPKLATVRPGVIVIFEDGKPKERIFVAGGFAEITQDTCTVLAEEAELVSDLSMKVVEARFDAANLAYQASLDGDDETMLKAESELRIAQAMLSAVKGELAYH